MSIHNAARRRRTPQTSKRMERRRALRRLMRRRRKGIGLRNRDRQRCTRLERRSVRQALRPIEASYHYAGWGDETLKFRQAA